MKHSLRLLLFFIGIIIFFAASKNAKAQTDPAFYDYAYNHLPWFEIESEHFKIIYQEGDDRMAQIVSRIAEEVYSPITSFYRYEPNTKVSIVLKNREDFSNGAAYFFDNKIDIWLPALDTPFRGTHNWLRNVITHEYTHIVQIQAAMKRGRTIPAFYLQWLSYEEVRRPDVLFGFPNGIITHPFATINIPGWLAEGTAQYQRAGLHYDTWDSHRDMILRMKVLNDSQLSLIEMGTFVSKTSLERELVYNQGFAFSIYLANRFGEDVLRRITESLGEKGVYRVEKAMERATGVSGEQLYADWVAERKTFYTQAISNIKPTSSSFIEDKGFMNFAPMYLSNGSIAYLSNKGQDNALLSLFVKNGPASTETAALNDLDFGLSPKNHEHFIGLMESPTVPMINGGYSFSPDAKEVVFVRIRKNSNFEWYFDLYLQETESKKNRLITKSARIQNPMWIPGERAVLAIQFSEGTQNVVRIDLETSEITPVTSFKKSEQIFSAMLTPDGKHILFSASTFEQRSIRLLDLDSGEIRDLLHDAEIDYRDPFISPDEQYLYFSANFNGIFNIYRVPWENPSSSPEQVTSVVGGAFMPSVSLSGELLFSEFTSGGYKIKTADVSQLLLQSQKGEYTGYNPRPIPDQHHISEIIQDINSFDDTDFERLPSEVVAIADTGSASYTIPTRHASGERNVSRYSDTFTGFSIFPVIRFDNYSRLNGRNSTLIEQGRFGDLGENLLRDMKTGIVFASRDVTDRMSIFGNVLFGLGSEPVSSIGNFFSPDRLVDLDRDIFLQIEHRGLPFIKAGWSPTVAIELFNVRRNVKNGLTIEEFPCTSCLPDTTFTDVAYEIWEAGFYLRSKLSRSDLLEVGISFSPSRVSTDDFFSRELNVLIPGSSVEFFRATTLSASYNFNFYKFNRDTDIAPIGFKGFLKYEFQPSRLLEEFEVKDGTLSPVFNNFDNQSLEGQLRYGFQVNNKHTFQLKARGFTYLDNPDEFFFLDYIGGFIGMRSYPFFALGGNQTAYTTLSYMAPIAKNMNTQVGPYTFDKLYARFFAEAGNGWNGPLKSGDNIKTGIGAELRFASSAYYLFPLKFFVSGSYGFNKFTVTLPDEFLTPGRSNRVTYGRELLFHFGLTFDFELL